MAVETGLRGIVVPIVGPSWPQVLDQLKMSRPWADVWEFRLDLIDRSAWPQVRKWLPVRELPALLTLRDGSWKALEELHEWDADYFDIDAEGRVQVASSTPLLPSSHRRSVDIELANHLYHLHGMLKWVVEEADWPQLFALLDLTRQGAITMVTGRLGEASRLLAALAGQQTVFASLSNAYATAKGQIPAQTLVQLYRYRQLSSQTRLLGLLGEPLHRSPGPLRHNRLLQRLGLDAVYVPFPIQPQELPLFLDRIREFSPIGFSVTMPLKQTVLQWVHNVTEEVAHTGSLNTLRYRNGEWEGCSTDGIGALDAIETYRNVRGVRLAIMGAGGTAASVAFEGRRRGAEVTLYNRTLSRAQELGERLGVMASPMQELRRGDYEVLVNCTPFGENGEQLLSAQQLNRGVVVLDAVLCTTPLLEEARKSGCIGIHGREMWSYQARAQWRYWFGEEINEVWRDDLEDLGRP